MRQTTPQPRTLTHKITVDINLLYAEPVLPAVDTLKRWRGEGKVEMMEVEPPRGGGVQMGWPGGPPRVVDNSNGKRTFRTKVKKDGNGVGNFTHVAALLFPQKDSHKLSMTEINDVAHLIRHYESKNEVFVTRNESCFIEGGRRELLKRALGIVAMTPDETVQMFKKSEGWK